MSIRIMLWIGVIAAFVLALVALQLAIGRETVRGSVTRNADGTVGHALVLYHPGLSDFQEALAGAFADGLVEGGWRVTITTTSRAATTDLRDVDLLVLGVHTYWFAPDVVTRRYLARAGDLGGTPVVALLSALGAAGRAAALTQEMIETAGGRVALVQPFFVLRPNDEDDGRPNRAVALELAHRLGLTMAPAP
jgi:hypothetical protein